MFHIITIAKKYTDYKKHVSGEMDEGLLRLRPSQIRCVVNNNNINKNNTLR